MCYIALIEMGFKVIRELGCIYPLLLHRISIANGHRIVINGLMINGDGIWRSYFILPAVSPAD